MKTISHNPSRLKVQSTNALPHFNGQIRYHLAGNRIIQTPGKF